MKIMKLLQLKSEKIKSIACGTTFTLVLSSNGQVFSFGLNESNQLGHSTNNLTNTLRLNCISSEIINKKTIKFISCGRDHSLLLSSDGEVFSFGNNLRGQCGNSIKSRNSNLCKIKLRRKAIAIAAGSYYSIAIIEGGLVYSWGAKDYIGVFLFYILYYLF